MKNLTHNLLNYFKMFTKNFLEEDVFGKSAQTAYYFVFSIFPIALLIVSFLPLLNIDMVMVYDFLYAEFPYELATFIYDILNNAFTNYSGYIVLGALLLTFWSASAATNSIIKGINYIYDGKITRNYIKGRFISFLLTISFFLYIFLTIVSLAFTSNIFDIQLLDIDVISRILNLVNQFILPIFMGGILMIIYYVAPAKKMTIKQTLPGIIFFLITFNLFSFGFNIYMEHASDMAATYGAFAGIIVFMLWCYALSIIILTGAVINVTLYKFITAIRMDSQSKKQQ